MKTELNYVEINEKRASGILLHISSLPSDYGIGTLGKAAYDFVDFLNRSKQKYWQILPLNPTVEGNSPYQSFSVFAGNPYFIDLDLLEKDGLLEKSDYENINFGDNFDKVDFDKIKAEKIPLIKKAYQNYLLTSDRLDLAKFKEENSQWLKDYSEFMALREKFDNLELSKWDIKLRKRDTVTYNFNIKLLDEDSIDYFCFEQMIFYKQYFKLKEYANENNVRIIGDIPIYIASNSADLWSNMELFQVDRRGNPSKVAGCPPDDYSVDGQHWGNPLYNWKNHEKSKYKWWISRLKWNLKLYDMVRIDHFRGLEAFWAIPTTSNNPVDGKWVNGPANKFVKAVLSKFDSDRIIAEDLGFLSEKVYKLRKSANLAGMRVLQFAFDPTRQNEHIPHNVSEDNVMYTGTHDNNTLRGWLTSTDRSQVNFAFDYLRLNSEESFEWGMIRGVWSSVARIAIAQMQDFLCRGEDSRMNVPNTLGNWTWRAGKGDFSDDLCKSIYKITKIYSRESN